MNSLNLTGRLVADPELRYTEDGRALCSMRIAVSGFAAVETLFLPLLTFGSEAEACSKHLRKGRRIGFSGRLQNRPWQAGDGTKRDSFSGVGHVEFLDSAPAQADGPAEHDDAPATDAGATPRRRRTARS
jgi:single-strand DNA-binding protein